MELLLLPERIQNIISQGESHFREFKTALEGPPDNKIKRDPKEIARDIGETLVGFANADGGDLLVGVEDNGTITGMKHSENTINQLLEAYKSKVHVDTPLYNVTAQTITMHEKTILFFSVDKSTKYVHLTSDGRCLQRSDKETIPVAVEQLHFERQEQISREYDRQFVDGAELVDLDLDLLNRIGELISPGLSTEKILQSLGIAEFSRGIHLRRAALLLFARDIYRWHPRSEVRLLRIKGTELKTGREYNVVSDESARGNITDLLSSAWEKLRPHLVETKLSQDALFKQRIMYPEDACREALTNALAHRDYGAEGRSIEIKIFDDRMEITSPGELLSNINIKDLSKLTGAHQSRNSYIARVLKEVGYMREMGEGIRRIFSLMKLNDLVSPELSSAESTFTITLHSKSVFSEDDQRYLKAFDSFNLNREEDLIVLLGKKQDLLSPQQIYDHLELVDWDEYRKIIDQIQIKGILFNTMHEKEKDRVANIKKTSKREIARLKVRTPRECEEGLKNLLESFKLVGPTNKITQEYLSSFIRNIPRTSIFYDENKTAVLKRLKFLSLIDNSNSPTSLLTSIWNLSPRPSERLGNEFKHQKSITSISPKQQKFVPSEVNPSHTIYVGNVPYLVTPGDFYTLFKKYRDKIKRIFVPVDLATNKGRGFAFVTVNSEEDGSVIIEEFNATIYKDRQLQLNWVKK